MQCWLRCSEAVLYKTKLVTLHGSILYNCEQSMHGRLYNFEKSLHDACIWHNIKHALTSPCNPSVIPALDTLQHASLRVARCLQSNLEIGLELDVPWYNR